MQRRARQPGSARPHAGDSSDAHYVDAFARRIGDLYPGCPRRVRQAIAEHACRKHSGRVGRSAAAKQSDETAIQLAVRAYIRHCHTSYDELLAGCDGSRGSARNGRGRSRGCPGTMGTIPALRAMRSALRLKPEMQET